MTLRTNLPGSTAHSWRDYVCVKPATKSDPNRNYRAAIKDLLMAGQKGGHVRLVVHLKSMSAKLKDLRPRRISSGGAWLRDCVRATLFLPLTLLGCSGVALTQTDAPASAPNPAAFHKIIGDYLKELFKDIAA